MAREAEGVAVLADRELGLATAGSEREEELGETHGGDATPLPSLGHAAIGVDAEPAFS